MEQISFFGDIGCKEPEPPKEKKRKRKIPEDLPDSARNIMRRGQQRNAAGRD